MVQLLAGSDEVEGKGHLGEEGERGTVLLQLFVERREFAVSHLQPSLLLLHYPTIVLGRKKINYLGALLLHSMKIQSLYIL